MDVLCRLCLGQTSSKLVLSLTNEEMRLMVDSVFNFEIMSVACYSDSVCLQCSSTIQEFYKYSVKVLRNQQLLQIERIDHEDKMGERVEFENVIVDDAMCESVQIRSHSESDEPVEQLQDTMGDCENFEGEEFLADEVDSSHEQMKDEPDSAEDKLFAIDAYEPHEGDCDEVAEATLLEERHAMEAGPADGETFQERFLRCNVCDRLFSSSLHYRSHQREHRKKECHICEKRVHASYLQRHITSVHGPKPPSGKRKQKGVANVQLPRSSYERDRMIDVFIGLRCELCQFGISQTFADLQKHYRAKHAGVSGYVRCCGTVFSTQSTAAEHVLKHQGTIRCDICQKPFTTKSSMVKHKILLHPAKDTCSSGERVFRCRLCNVTFANRTSFISHRSKHDRKNCAMCGKSIRKNYMKKHMADVHAVSPNDGAGSSVEKGSAQHHENDRLILDYLGMLCELCPPEAEQRFEQFKNLRTHYRTKHSIRGYVRCCGRQFFIRALAAEHIAAHQGALRCHLCDKTFTARSSVINHIANIHPSYNSSDRSYDCDECDSTFANKLQLRLHKKRHRLTSTQCTLCGKTVRSDYVQQHIATQHAEARRKLMCHICGKDFASEAVLSVHIKQHEDPDAAKLNVERMQCSVCNKMIRGKYSLKKHMKDMHSDASNRECPVCGKFIRSNTAMKQHMQTHQGKGREKLQCPYCAKWVKGKYYLSKHIQCLHHEKGQLFRCEDCPHESPNSQALAAHRQRVHDTVPSREKFECEFCGKTFKRTINLREHVAMHTGELLYTCEFCGKKFKSNANYYSHRKKQHWEELQAKNEEQPNVVS